MSTLNLSQNQTFTCFWIILVKMCWNRICQINLSAFIFRPRFPKSILTFTLRLTEFSQLAFFCHQKRGNSGSFPPDVFPINAAVVSLRVVCSVTDRCGSWRRLRLLPPESLERSRRAQITTFIENTSVEIVLLVETAALCLYILVQMFLFESRFVVTPPAPPQKKVSQHLLTFISTCSQNSSSLDYVWPVSVQMFPQTDVQF